jgi:signal transduction histidine kinase
MVAWLLEEEREAAVRLEESLRRRETLSAMGALVAGVAHEVRNPLFGISASLDAFEARFGFQDAAGPYLTAMRAQVQRMGQLMTELLEYGRPIGSAFAEEPLGDVLQEAVQSCAALAVQSDVTVEADPNAGALLVPMDRPRLVQVFQNLIQNAVEHTPRGSRVLVGVKTEELHGRLGVQCAIRDFGPGFGSSDLPRIFDPFFTRRRGGTGLGLSIVRRIVQQHSGDVQAANHPEGGGVVSVWLPVADPSDLARSDRNVTRA